MNIKTTMEDIGKKAKSASMFLATSSSKDKELAIKTIADYLWKNKKDIILKNEIDMEFSAQKKLSDPMIDRLLLNEGRLSQIIECLNSIAEFEDPVGKVLKETERKSGLRIKRITTPIGVVGVIFESRPNVFADAGALCLKSGNASILRCGSESLNTSMALKKCFNDGLQKCGFPEYSVQLVPTRDRKAVDYLITMLGFVDVIIPRGGKSLVELIQKKARVPVFAHLEGIVHIFVDEDADLEMTSKVIINSKTRRPGICGAVECLLIDQRFFQKYGAPFLKDLIDLGVEVRAEGCLRKVKGTVDAKFGDWGREYLDKIISAKPVNGIDEAISHIQNFGSNHTDCIITNNDEKADQFFSRLDSSIVMRNASTQFADGGEFGFGAEIGIATGKLHARGPIGCEQLTTFKYLVEGSGTIRK